MEGEQGSEELSKRFSKDMYPLPLFTYRNYATEVDVKFASFISLLDHVRSLQCPCLVCQHPSISIPFGI